MSNDIQEIADKIIALSLGEAASLRDALKSKLGLTDADLAGPTTGGGVSTQAEAPSKAAEKVEFDVILKDMGANKNGVIKACKTILKLVTGVEESLLVAKKKAESAPTKLAEKVNKQTAEEVMKLLKEAGADCVME